MAVANSFTRDMPLAVEIDREADVLYLSGMWDGAVEGTGRPDGVELNFRLDTDDPCGVTVIGFTAYGWHRRLPELAKVAGSHLGISPHSVLARLTAALAD